LLTQLRLTRPQQEQKDEHVTEVATAKECLEKNEDPAVQAHLQAELEQKQGKLAELLNSFEVQAWSK
jgi:hypothetical protein